jgi:hypothetical protein
MQAWNVMVEATWWEHLKQKWVMEVAEYSNHCGQSKATVLWVHISYFIANMRL